MLTAGEEDEAAEKGLESKLVGAEHSDANIGDSHKSGIKTKNESTTVFASVEGKPLINEAKVDKSETESLQHATAGTPKKIVFKPHTHTRTYAAERAHAHGAGYYDDRGRAQKQGHAHAHGHGHTHSHTHSHAAHGNKRRGSHDENPSQYPGSHQLDKKGHSSLHHENHNHGDHNKNSKGFHSSHSGGHTLSAHSGHGHSHGVPEGAGSSASFIILFLALSFHGLMEGVALGAMTDSEHTLMTIFIAIISHKGLESFSLGTSLTRGKVSTFNYWFFLIGFSLTTTVGIAIGMILSASLDSSVASNVCVALASGTFIYVAISEVILKELADSRDKAVKMSLLLLGFCLMSLLARYI